MKQTSVNPEKAWDLNSLASAYFHRFNLKSERSDLDNAIYYAGKSVTLMDNLEYKAGFLGNLSGYLQMRYRVLQNKGDLVRAIKVAGEAVALCREHNKPYLIDALIGFSGILRDRFFLENQTDDLKISISCLDEARDLNCDDEKNISIITPLAECFADYYQATGKSEYLQLTKEHVAQIAKAIDEHNVEQKPIAHLYLGGLGNLYNALYSITNNIDYLQSAIDVFRKAADSIENINIQKAVLLSNLGSVLSQRAELTQGHDDLTNARINLLEAIHYFEKHDLESASQYQSLANAERQAFRVWKDITSIQNAVDAARKAVEVTPEGSADLPLYLNSLGLLLIDYSFVGNKEEIIVEAVDTLSQCLEITNENSFFYLPALENLGYAYNAKFKVSNDYEDIVQSIEYYQQALDRTPIDSTDRFPREFNLLLALIDLAKRSNEKKDWLFAFNYLEKLWDAYDTLFATTPMSFKGTMQEKHIYFQLESVDLALDILSLGLELNADEKRNLFRKLFVYAEGSKSRIVNEMLGRGTISYFSIPEDLLKKEQILHQKLVELDKLQYILYERMIKDDQSIKRIQVRTTARASVLDKLNKVWDEISNIGREGAEYVAIRRGDRLKWDEVSAFINHLKPNEAYLSLFIVYNRTVLLLMRPGWEEPKIFIENFGETRWNQILTTFKSEIPGRKSGNYFWADDLAILFEMIREDLDGVDTLIISPHRHGNQIPWTAIPFEEDILGLRYKIVIAPSIGVLRRIKKRTDSDTEKVLIVGNPQGDLINAEKEAITIANFFNSDPLLGSAATAHEVIKKLPKVKIAHFAAHSSSNPLDPLYSSIELADKKLKASDVLQEKINIDLLVVSSCKSGLAGNFGGDENIGLGQAFLMSGARSVIVSLWEIDDESTSFFMESFYSELIKGISKSDALQLAIKKTSDVQKWNKPFYWSPFMLMGDWE